MKEFNVTGVCVRHKHYMVNISGKLAEIIKLIEKDRYFTINRARQYGKTTTLLQIYMELKDRYLVLDISFEGMGDKAFSTEKDFIDSFIKLVSRQLKQNNVDTATIMQWEEKKNELDKMEDLSEKISQLVENSRKEVILLIDEVDKSSNNQLFLHFIGMLRDKYLGREKGYEKTFKSVILAGLYDVKNLKLKLRPDEERKYNSPWNIAADFDVDMSFHPDEICTMLTEYEKDYGTGMDIGAISNEIYRFTDGYPYLVSKLCKIIDEKMGRIWTLQGVEDAAKLLLDEKNTLFDDLIKNLENNKALYALTYDILVEGKKIQYNAVTPVIDMGIMFGVFKKESSFVTISNRIYELCIYNYMISKRSLEKGELVTYEYRSSFVADDKLDMELVLTKFQEVMHDGFREKDAKFIEREGRLLFLCFLKPIINGRGFYYVEAETRMDNRMDVIVSFGGQQHIVELKIWHGDNYEKNALKQLAGYLESKRETVGYLVSFNFNKNKEYTKEWKKSGNTDIFTIVV